MLCGPAMPTRSNTTTGCSPSCRSSTRSCRIGLTRCTLTSLTGRYRTLTSEKSAEWRQEQADTQRQIEVHEQANQSYIEDGIQLVELADKAYDLYTAQPPDEQRRLLTCVLSGATWANGCLTPVYRPPFDLIVHSNHEYASKHNDSGESPDKKHIWLPKNPRNPNFLAFS